jgi:hypothetical protein
MADLNVDPDAVTAVVCLKRGTLPSLNDISSFIAGNWPGHSCPTLISAGDDSLLFQIDDEDDCVIRLERAPFTSDDLKYGSDNAWWWPEAGKELESHAAHLVISLGGGDDDPLTRFFRLTYITCAVVSLTEALAVFWPSAALLFSAEDFMNVAEESKEHDPPLPLRLWVDFQIFESDELFNLYTTGLELLGYPEIEIQDSNMPPEEMLDIAHTVALYMVGASAVFEDEAEIELGGDRKLLAKYAPSICSQEDTVLSLSILPNPFTILPD